MNEIIIDGVNVAECEFFTDRLFTNCDKGCSTYARNCDSEYSNNCYYKQLQRLKAENEKLKAENDGLKIIHQRYRECSIQFNQKHKQALEKVKKECTKPLNEKFLINDFLNAKDEELTEVGIMQRNILKIIDEVLNNVENK